jgi:peptidoglycan/LPS O-acetylase OafA/YrhL
MSSAKYIKSLDGVRAIAALLVLIFHFSQYAIFQSDWGKLLQKIGYLGQTGVSLFFVLSPYENLPSLLRNYPPQYITFTPNSP